MQRIKSVTFQDSDHRYGNKEAVALMDDGSEVEEIVFHWFDDELSFIPNELIGLTLEEARDLKHARDVAYLQS
jgi:hypothetical protein